MKDWHTSPKPAARDCGKSTGPVAGTAAIVSHLTKDHVRIIPSAGWKVVIFNITTTDAEAVVIADDGSETIRLHIAPPKLGQFMTVKIGVEGAERGVDIVYGAKVND